jgi:hypothetical protein
LASPSPNIFRGRDGQSHLKVCKYKPAKIWDPDKAISGSHILDPTIVLRAW